MEALAIAVGALIAVGGWVANGFLARRSVRRQLRVEFLLSAFRRLEAASNRALTNEHANEIESAVSDIYLLGTESQVDLVDDFANEFARSGSAD